MAKPYTSEAKQVTPEAKQISSSIDEPDREMVMLVRHQEQILERMFDLNDSFKATFHRFVGEPPSDVPKPGADNSQPQGFLGSYRNLLERMEEVTNESIAVIRELDHYI